MLKTIKYIPVGILITFETIRTSNNINIIKFSIKNLLILGFLSESDIFLKFAYFTIML